MAEYAAFGPVMRGRVSALPSAMEPAGRPVEEPRIDAGTATIEGIDEPASTRRSRLRDRVTTAREQWSITTFYLFDPNSWR
jgi:hypothetical protein